MITFKNLSTLFVGLLLIVSGCNQKAEQETIDTELIIEQVTEQVQAFHRADTSRNAEGVVALLWPEYTMLVDGHYISYEDVTKGSPVYMASLESFHTEWTDLRVVPLNKYHAISSYIFNDSIVAKDGTVTRSKGPNTFVWEKRNGIWKVIYGDADHYPLD